MHELINSVNQINLSTERLTIRNFKSSDYEQELAHSSDPIIMRYIGDMTDKAVLATKVRDLISPWQGKEGEWVGLPVCITEQDQFIGMIFINFESLEFSRVANRFQVSSGLSWCWLWI